jgi:hypothetical protein
MATEQQVEQAKAEISRILSGVPKETAVSALRKVTEKFELDEAQRQAVAENERGRLEADLTHLHVKDALLRSSLEALRILDPWLKKPPQLVLEKNECSRLHRLKEAAQAGRIIDGSKKDLADVADGAKHIVAIEHTFVVKHDWASAFASAPDAIGEFHIPFPACTFEFRVDGRTVILWVQETDTEMGFTAFIESQDHWYAPPENDEDGRHCDGFLKFLWNQVRAICIALDAEVATHSVIRAPHKLNEKRERAGKPKVIDYHVIDLSRRHRVAGASGSSTGRHVRLHFRRGHWRHFETTKTWIKWCLVGDPDLGFIQKHYSL